MFVGVNINIHTDYHASADVTELWFLAVVVLEFVRFVINPDDSFLRFWFLLFHLNLLLIYKIDLYIKQNNIPFLFTKKARGCVLMHTHRIS